MKLLYLHGWMATPPGFKATYLASVGFEVVTPTLPDDDFAESTRIAQEAVLSVQPAVIVGSSRGGAVAVNIDTGAVPLVLIAPAYRHWGSQSTVKANAIILHSPEDAVIPFEDSVALMTASGLPADRLWRVGAGHPMTDAAALDALVRAVRHAGGAD